MKELDIIIDLQFGSTGKGLIAGYLAETCRYDTVINANMPNAGHTYVNRDGRKWMHKVLPNGIVSPNLKRVMIGPGAVFSEKQLMKELDDSADILKRIPILIHENAVVLQPHHAKTERAMLEGISSTMQGSAAAMIQKIWRKAEKSPCVSAAGIRDRLQGRNYVYIVTSERWNEIMAEGVEYALLEGAQGYSLGLNAGFWPHCTSRDCTPARFMADCQVPHNKIGRVIGTARVHPIRVGSLPGFTSGGCYPDQEEIEWADINQKPELTTVTGRERRIFTFSYDQLRQAIMACQPTDIFLNFCNYDKEGVPNLKWAIDENLRTYGPKGAGVTWTGWGPSFDDIQDNIRPGEI